MQYPVSLSFILLSIDPEKGSLINYGTSFNYGLAGAIIMDMTTAELLKTENGKLLPNQQNSDSEVANNVLELMHKRKKPRSIKNWITKIGGHPAAPKKAFLQMLEDQNLIKIIQKRWLGLIPYKRYSLLKPDDRQKLIHTLREDLLSDKKLSQRESTLLGLIKATNIQKILYNNDIPKKEIRQQLKKRMKEDALSNDVSKSIQEVQTAIMAASTAGTIAATTSAS
jgi:hypothetical protein